MGTIGFLSTNCDTDQQVIPFDSEIGRKLIDGTYTSTRVLKQNGENGDKDPDVLSGDDKKPDDNGNKKKTKLKSISNRQISAPIKNSSIFTGVTVGTIKGNRYNKKRI